MSHPVDHCRGYNQRVGTVFGCDMWVCLTFSPYVCVHCAQLSSLLQDAICFLMVSLSHCYIFDLENAKIVFWL